MKQVEFVRVDCHMSGLGFKSAKYTFPQVEDIIRERVEAGWDYRGYVPLMVRGTGELETISLVFQREENTP